MLSSVWSFWVQAIVIGSMIACGILIVYTSKGQKKEETDETTGHSYDGIEELDNPLPRWWVGMFWATIVFGFGYIGIYGLANFDGFGTVKVDGEDVTWTQTNQWKAEVQAFAEDLSLSWHSAGTTVAESSLDLLGRATIEPDFIGQVRCTNELVTFTVCTVTGNTQHVVLWLGFRSSVCIVLKT